MRQQGDDARRADSFRKPASYDREAWSDAPGGTPPDAASGQERDSGGTRAFSPEELEDARRMASDDDATTLLGSQAAASAPAAQGTPEQGPAYREGTTPRGQARPAARQPRTDQTLVSPIAQERIRAEVQVPDPAFSQRRPQAGRVPNGYGRQAPAYGEQQPAQPPLRRRRAPRPQQPPMAQQGYGYQQPYPQASYPQAAQPQYLEEEPRHGHGAARAVLLLVSWALRLAALGLVALVVANALTMGNRVAVMRVTAQVTQLLPKSLAGLYVLDSPLGGVFRGDFAIAAVVLFVLDWIVARVRRRLR